MPNIFKIVFFFACCICHCSKAMHDHTINTFLLILFYLWQDHKSSSHHKSPSPMMIITPSHSHSQASDPLGQSEDKLEAGQWEAQVGLECSHCSQSPTLVVIIAGLTLTHSSLSDQLSPVLGVCCFKALCAHWWLVSIMRTITYRQQTPEQPPPPLTCLQCPQHQVVDTRH